MLNLIRNLAAALLVSTALAIGLAGPARAAEAPAPPTPPPTPEAANGPIGMVDMERVLAEATPIKDAYAKLGEYQKRLDENLKDVAAQKFLNKAEIQEYTAIMDGDKRTDLQTKRFAELKQTSGDREKEWLKLAQTANPDANQKKRRDELSKMLEERDQALDDVQKDYQGRINKQADTILTPVVNKAGETIGQVAAERKLAIVLPKRIPTGVRQDGTIIREDVILWGGNDLTPEVIKRLNKK